MQGWSPDFIPKLTEDALALGLVDEVRPVSGAEALRLARALATEEGILAGISGGATLAGAIEVARALPPDAVVLCMIPDTGERYLSTPLFADITAEMTEEELALSRSTPGQRFDTPPPVAAAQPAAAVAVTPEAERFVREVIADPSRPVVMFALEWCEFCWSVRRMLSRFGVAFRSIDLDAVEYQAGDRGGAIRGALTAMTGANTLPQIFIGGELVGGAMDLMEAWRSGHAQTLLERHGVAFDREPAEDPRTFLPGWLQPRSAA
jgi:cysteine synthase A